MKIGQSAGKDFAYILGVFLGDGCVYNHQGYNCFRLNTIDEDFALATKQALSGLVDSKYKTSIHSYQPKLKNASLNYSLRNGDTDFATMLQEITNKKQRIPSCLHLWSKGLKKQFIIGLMDSEGFVAENRKREGNKRFYMGFKSCDIWINDFIKIVQDVGLKIGKISTEEPRKSGYKTPTRFHIKMNSWVREGMKFNIKRKQHRVDVWSGAKINLND